MPTHRDHPWERDLAAVTGHRPPRRAWRGPVAAAALVAVAVLVLVGHDPHARVARASRAPAAAPSGAVKQLHTRFAGRRTLEVWGRATAPDGATVRIRVAGARGRGSMRRPAPAAHGHFYARLRLPRVLRGRPLSVSAAVARGG